MDYAEERWCMRCGAPCGECKHCADEDNRMTADAEQAVRIRNVYKGIEVHWEKRKHK